MTSNIYVNISNVFYGTLIHSLRLCDLEILPNALIGVDTFGKIAFVEKNVLDEKKLNDIISRCGNPNVIRLTQGQFLMPGFVDTHTHAPQYPNAGIGMDEPLLEWLKKYTFPLEKCYSSLSFAEKVYPIVVKHLLSSGTTTAAYYSTIHLESSKYLARVVKEKGQRGFIGKVNMDCNSPDDYVETVEDGVKSTEKFIEYINELNSEGEGEKDKSSRLVHPVITPRFAVSCTSELMKSLGTLAKEHNTPIQSHLSENLEELEKIRELFPDLPDYTTVYDHFGLLNEKTIMAHGIYLSQKERELIKERNVGISHCPTSNFVLSSGICNVRRLLNEDIKVGLGTDLSGGYSKSMLNAIRNASIASNVIFMTSKTEEVVFPHLTLPELIYLATMGGARLVNLDNIIGNFLPGKEFDALLVDARQPPLDIFDGFDDIERIFEKFIFLGDERNIKSVYVKGKKVSGTDLEDVNLRTIK